MVMHIVNQLTLSRLTTIENLPVVKECYCFPTYYYSKRTLTKHIVNQLTFEDLPLKTYLLFQTKFSWSHVVIMNLPYFQKIHSNSFIIS